MLSRRDGIGEKDFIWQNLIIFVLCLVCYSGSLLNNFMMDDFDLLPQIRSMKLDLSGLSLFTHHLNGFFRPIPNIFLKISTLLFGLNPVYYHTLNLFLFFLICSLFLVIGNKLFFLFLNEKKVEDAGRINKTVFFAVILYCVHPINNIIVNYITGSMLAVSVLINQMSYLNFLLYIEQKKKLNYVLSVFFYLCALFSHETSVILPIYMWLTYFYLKPGIKNVYSFFSPYLACLILYIYIYLNISIRHHSLGILFRIPFQNYICCVSKLIHWYVLKLLLPVNLLFLWEVSVKNSCSPASLTALFLMMGAVVALFYFLISRKKQLELFCLSFFWAGFLPLFLASFTYTSITATALIEPHWFYFSSIGFFFLASILFFYLFRNFNQYLRIAACLSLVIILVVLTKESNRVWKETETYCRHWIKLDHFNFMPIYYMTKVQLKYPVIRECELGHSAKCEEFIHRFTDSSNDPYIYLQLIHAFLYINAPHTALDLRKQFIKRYPGFNGSVAP